MKPETSIAYTVNSFRKVKAGITANLVGVLGRKDQFTVQVSI
jgi:hypothetical protein